MKQRRRSCRAMGTVSLAAALAAPALAQSARVDGGSVSTDRFDLYWETRLDPPVPPVADGFGAAATIDDSGVVHRVLLDRSRQVYVGYDVMVGPAAGIDTFAVAFEPLTLPADFGQKLLGREPGRWRRRAAPVLPPPQTVRGGQVLEVGLTTGGVEGQTLVDYLTIQEPSRGTDGFENAAPREFGFAEGQARDFRAQDAELRLERPRVRVDGAPDPASQRVLASASGAVVWIYMPHRGRFLLSLAPNADTGFRRAGEVRGSSLAFSSGGERFTLTSAGRIAPGQAAFNLYVLHEPAWRPSYPGADLDMYILGAADRAEYLVRR